MSLEELYPTYFGDFDEEQLYAVRNGFSDVVKTENANELVRIFVQEFKKGYVLDLLLRTLGEKLNIYTVDSVTFEVLHDYYKLLEDDSQICKLARSVIEFITSNKQMFGTVVGINLRVDERTTDDYGGHYCAMIITKNVDGFCINIFDSIHSERDHGYYMTHFISLATEIMMKVSDYTRVPFKIYPVGVDTHNQKLQATGGFSKNDPQFRDLYIKQYGKRLTDGVIRMFGIDSQNHFCYMWCIWFLHLRASFDSESADKIFKSIAFEIQNLRCIPLVVIKRYIYALMFGNDVTAKEFNKFEITFREGKQSRRISNIFIRDFMMKHFTRVLIFPLPRVSDKSTSMESVQITFDMSDVRSVLFSDAFTYSIRTLMTQAGSLIDFECKYV
jgi:hypothetical protein